MVLLPALTVPESVASMYTTKSRISFELAGLLNSGDISGHCRYFTIGHAF